MIQKKIFLLTVLPVLSFVFSNPVSPQDNTSTRSVIAEILSQMPAADPTALESQMNRLAGTGETGLLELAGMLLSPEKGNDAPVRYAMNSFSNYVTGKGQEKPPDLSTAWWGLEKVSMKCKSFLISA
jgi:hypothetical protein